MNRKLFRRLLGIGTIAAVFSAAPLFGAGDAPSASNETIRYTAPAHSAQSVRVNVVRPRDGNTQHFPNLFILTPEHVGLTVQEQPSIFWYLSEPTKTTLKVTITKNGADEPLYESPLPTTAGIQRLNLSETHVKLDPDVEYQVNFALIPDPKHRSDDLCASGVIKRVKPPQALVARLVSRANPLDRAITYAKEGIWYDALAVISDGIDGKDVQDPSAMRKQRAALLEQVSLRDVASYDLAAADK